MKPLRTQIVFAIWAAIVALVIIAVPTNAVHVVNEARGCSTVTVENVATGDTRSWSISTADGLQTDCVDDLEIRWRRQTPGDTVELFIDSNIDGPLPPGTVDSLTVEVFQDDTNNLICTLIDLDPPDLIPAESSLTFDLTTNCLNAGTDIAGVWRIKMTIQNDEVVNANDYICDTDGGEVVGAAANCTFAEAGAIVGCMAVSSITVPAPPSGTTYAFGISADESFTATVTRTRAFSNIATNDVRITTILPPDTTAEDGGAQDAAAATTTTDSFVTDDTYGGTDFAATTYGIRFELEGNAIFFNPNPIVWTSFCNNGNGAGIIKDSLTKVRDADTNNANGHVRFDLDGTSPFDGEVETNHEIYNRVEAVTCDFFILNARGQQVTRSATVTIRNTGDVAESTQTRSGANYLCSYTTGSAHTATNDILGSAKTVRWTTGGSTANTNAAQFTLSSLYFLDSHLQSVSTLSQDDFPTEDSQETFEYISGEDIIYIWCHVKGVRKDVNIDTNANSVTRIIRDAANTAVLTDPHDTGTDGWSAAVDSIAASPPTGLWEAECNVTFNGNTGTDIEDFSVISAFTADKLIRLAFHHIDAGTIRIWCLVELDNEPFTPDDVPTIRIGGPIFGESVWTEWIDPPDLMLNAVDNTATVNGALYYYDFDWVESHADVNWNVWISALFNAVEIRQTETLDVPDLENEMLVTAEMFVPLLAFILCIIWAERTREPWIYVLGIIAGITAVITLWDAVAPIRILVIVAIAFIGIRIFNQYRDRGVIE